MLSDLFGLLTDARSRVSANVKAIEAKRDFWLASVDLQAAIYGGGMSGPIGTAAATLASGNPE
jgi:outer membrane protein TolC